MSNLLQLPGEIWKEVKNFEGRFWISNLGRLKSHNPHKSSTKILKCHLGNLGYYITNLRMKPQNRKVRIHTLVAEHFLEMPVIEGRPVVNHIDGNKLNNNVSNLEWVSGKRNCEHAVETGLVDIKGSKHPNAKLTEEDVRKIRTLYPSYTQKVIASMFGICRRQAGDIINRVNWKHVA